MRVHLSGDVIIVLLALLTQLETTGGQEAEFFGFIEDTDGFPSLRGRGGAVDKEDGVLHAHDGGKGWEFGYSSPKQSDGMVWVVVLDSLPECGSAAEESTGTAVAEDEASLPFAGVPLV